MNTRVAAQTGYSKAKGVIYQQDDGRPLTPEHKGTKGPPADTHSHLAPFATADVATEAYPAEFHPIERHTGVTGKAAADAFDPLVYRNNRADNVKNMAESKLRNHGGGNTPYAMQAVDGQAEAFSTRTFHMQEREKQLPDKIGAAVNFDVEVYRKSRSEHMQQQLESRQKNWGAGDGSGDGCPFATSNSAEYKQQWQRVDYHPKKEAKGWADKVGADKSFDPVVYSNAVMANREQQATSTQRNFVGSGKILEFQPGGHCQ